MLIAVSTDMDKFYAVYLSVIIGLVGKQTCMIPRDLHHTPSMAAYKMIRLKFESACKSSICRRALIIIIIMLCEPTSIIMLLLLAIIYFCDQVKGAFYISG